MGLDLELKEQPAQPVLLPAPDAASAWTRKINWMRQNMCTSAQWDHKDNLIAVALAPQSLPGGLTNGQRYGKGGNQGGKGDTEHDPTISDHDLGSSNDPSVSDPDHPNTDLGKGGVGGKPDKPKLKPRGRSAPKPTILSHPVWAYWVKRWLENRTAGGRPPLLDKKRLGLIVARLQDGFDQQTLMMAIDGIWASQWHRQADQVRFDLCLRDAAHVERFSAEGVKLNGAAGPGKHAPLPPMPHNVPIDPQELLPLSEIAKLAAGPPADAEPIKVPTKEEMGLGS